MKLKCTQCGADLEIRKDSGFMVCPYCDSSLFVEMDRTVRHYSIKPIVVADGLAPTVQRSLAALELKDRIELTNAKFVYFPFWQLHLPLRKRYILPAATTTIEDLGSVSIPVGELQFYQKQEEGQGELIEPETLLDGAMAHLAGRGVNDEVARSDLVHLPLFFVGYSYQGRAYQAAVDAVSGKVYADSFPPSRSNEKDRFFAGMVLLTFAIFLVEGIVVPGFGITIMAYVATSALLYLAIKKTMQKKGW